jgi:general secretion pathway protein K
MDAARAKLAWVWWELTRPRGRTSHAFYRHSRRSQSGIALLIALSSIAFMTIIITEVAFASTVRLQLGAHQRDQVKAEALANTGVNLYRLILSASKGLGSGLKGMVPTEILTMLGLDGDSLWQMVPFLNTNMMRMLFVSGGSADEEELTDYAEEGLTDEQEAASREDKGSEHNFLDFDGDFAATVTDEDRKINVAKFTATSTADVASDPRVMELVGMMGGRRMCPSASITGPNQSATSLPTMSEQDQEDLDQFFADKNIDRMDLIGNLVDWIDADNTRIYRGGSEDTLYNTLEREPYLPKNAPFDSMDEIRLVDGWNDDDVWEKFGKNLTVYGSGKINMQTADCDVRWGLIRAALNPTPNDGQMYQILQQLADQQVLTPFSDAKSYVTFLSQLPGYTVRPELTSAFGAESSVFRVTSTGTVGDATVTIDAVFDYSGTGAQGYIGKVVSWRIR